MKNIQIPAIDCNSSFLSNCNFGSSLVVFFKSLIYVFFFSWQDDSDDSSCDKWETNNSSSEINDHSYLRAKGQGTEPSAPVKYKNVKQGFEDIDVVSCDQPGTSRTNKENIPIILLQPQTRHENISLPVKKKRGRKPGSKSQRSKPYSVRSIVVSPRYTTPTLKHPERYPDLINYTDYDDDRTFVRNTSKDVMWSSTQPFQETLEYQVLKSIHDRQSIISTRTTNFPQLVRIHRP